MVYISREWHKVDRDLLIGLCEKRWVAQGYLLGLSKLYKSIWIYRTPTTSLADTMMSILVGFRLWVWRAVFLCYFKRKLLVRGNILWYTKIQKQMICLQYLEIKLFLGYLQGLTKIILYIEDTVEYFQPQWQMCLAFAWTCLPLKVKYYMK